MKIVYTFILLFITFSIKAQQWVLDEIADEQDSYESIPAWLIVLLLFFVFVIYKHLKKKDEEAAIRRAKKQRIEEVQRLEEELQVYREEQEIEKLDNYDDILPVDEFEDDFQLDCYATTEQHNIENVIDNEDTSDNSFNKLDLNLNREIGHQNNGLNKSTSLSSNTIKTTNQLIPFVIESDNIEPIDLGLSVKWSNLNLGASSTDLCGKFFIWGEIVEHHSKVSTIRTENVGNCAYKVRNNYFYTLDGKNKSELEQLLDGKTTICGNPHYDVACNLLGNGWRLPSKKEAEELQTRCKWNLTTYKGLNGVMVIGPNGNSIFIPFAGYIATDPQKAVLVGSVGIYWLGDPTLDNKGYASAFNIQESTSPYFPVSNAIVHLRRCMAHSIRPVFDKTSL